jgi:hypothetical protein
MFRRIYVLCLVLAMFVSCREGEGSLSVESDGRFVKFNLFFDGAAATRVTNDQWEEDDRVGIYMIPYVGAGQTANFATYTSGQNKEHRVGTTSASSDLFAVGNYLQFPSNNAEVSFVAFYPYKSDLATRNHIYPVNVADQSDPTAIDLLYCDTKGGMKYNGSNQSEVNMAFSHKLTKVVISLDNASTTLSPANLSSATLSISGMPTTADFNLSTATLSNVGGTATIAPVVKSSAADRIVWEAIVVPHNITNYPSNLLITVNNKLYTVGLPKVAIDAGKRYTLYCHLESSGVALDTPTTYAAASNSYLVAPGAEIYIPVSRANEHVADAIGESDELSAEFLWADAPLLLQELTVYGTGAAGAIKVKASGSKTGNAVIAVKVGGVIKWSWHIWVIDYNPDSAAWMDRNLGATSGTATDGAATFGLYYQWGRKDPFPRANSFSGGERTIYTSIDDATGATYNIADNKVTAAQTIDYTILNPKTFIGVNGSWLTGSAAEGLWYSNGKTIYDPCPAGYRLSSNLFSGRTWSDDLKGQTSMSIGGWYPASGRREPTGVLAGMGSDGCIWSAHANVGSKGVYMWFDAFSITHSPTTVIAYGFSVRCIRINP